jgi:hypothetical protein
MTAWHGGSPNRVQFYVYPRTSSGTHWHVPASFLNNYGSTANGNFAPNYGMFPRLRFSTRRLTHEFDNTRDLEPKFWLNVTRLASHPNLPLTRTACMLLNRFHTPGRLDSSFQYLLCLWYLTAPIPHSNMYHQVHMLNQPLSGYLMKCSCTCATHSSLLNT